MTGESRYADATSLVAYFTSTDKLHERLYAPYGPTGVESGSVEADAGLVGQAGDPLGSQHRRQGAKHAWQAPGRHHWHPVHGHLAPGDLGAVDGHDRDHDHVGVGQDLGGLV